MKILQLFFLFLLVMYLSGCVTSNYEFKWVAKVDKDPFTDEETCKISTWNVGETASMWRVNNSIYPLIEVNNGEVLVGVSRSPVRIGNAVSHIPVGNVQMRIDNNVAWTIEVTETHVTHVPNKNLGYDLSKVIKNDDLVDKDAYAAAIQNAQKTIVQTMSPKTMASGAKAKAILHQLKTGKSLIYRQFAQNVPTQPAVVSLKGIDAELAKCGV